MMKTMKRFLSMLMALSILFGLLVSPTMAVSVEESAVTVQPSGKTESSQEKTENAEDTTDDRIVFGDTVIINDKKLKVDLTGNVQASGEVDYNDPAIVIVAQELKQIKVLNEDGQKVALTEEQIGTVLYLYQQYLDHWTANANVLGVQVPFFLTYNDNGEDGLGVLGEMLALANVPVEDVRSGDYSYDDLVGMIQNFTYGDTLGVQYYGAAIAAARDEVMALVEASGAQTDAQKLLVINDWLAHVCTFDMPYIMNSGKADGEKPMVAPEPVKFERYDDVYAVIYADYEPQIRQQFHDEIYAQVVAGMRQTYYENVIRDMVYQGAVEQGVASAAQTEAFLDAAVQAYREEKYQEALEAEEQKVYDETYDAAYREYMNEQCDHTALTAVVDWDASTADATCGNCGLVFADQAATVTKESTASTCTEAGEDVYTATVYVVGDDGAALGTLTETKTESVPATGHTYVEGTCSVCGEAETVEEEVTVEETTEETTTVNVDDDMVTAADAVATKKANEAVEAAAADIEAAANAAADAAVAALTDEEKVELATELVKADEATMASIEEQANAAADDFMTENEAAIDADALGFIAGMTDEQTAAYIESLCDDFIATAETDGVEVQPGVVMTIEDLTQNTMENEAVINLGSEEEPYMVTPNEAIVIYADQAAQGLTGGVINYWEGSHFGALGFGTSVCLGYAKAYTYLVQCLYPEVYGKDGASTDLTVSENWKTREELYYNENGELDVDAGYVVDLVRVTFDASVTMYGQTEENFNSDHFWNAIKLDGKWYYVDPCYTDVFTEVMMRDRVETDGDMNHLYFLFSHTSCEKLYEGNYSEIKTLYAELATYTDYEDSWMSRIKSNVYSDGEYFYYLYDSTDMITLMEESENSMTSDIEESVYKIVRHKIDSDDTADGDTDYETLVFFNATVDDVATSVIYDPTTMANVDSELLYELYQRHVDYEEKYPSLSLGMALYEGKVYFNVANCILSYDPADGALTLVKEYSTVYGKRDDTKPFGGMAFSVVGSAEEADFTVVDHPLAGLTLKGDGKLYVSVATNFAFISGKDPLNSADQSSYGYEFEETNYNAAYSSYNDYGGYTDEELAEYGYTRETNDNDEFMWTANFVEVLDMAHLAGAEHTYEAVTVDATCDRDGYTENICTTCGAAEDGSRVVAEGTACDHHFILFTEQFYTKDDAGRWNTGECYICTVCLDSVTEPIKPSEDADYSMTDTTYEEQLAIYEEEKAIYDAAAASAGHHYVPTDATWAADGTTVIFSQLTCDNICTDKKDLLDCLIADGTVSVTLSGSIAAEAVVTDYEGDCATGLTAIYTASGEAEGYPYSVSTPVEIEAGKHAYEATFTWTETEDGGFTATADLVCAICGDAHEDMAATVTYDAASSAAATCTAAGKDVYSASVIVTDENGNEIGSATGSHEVTLEMLPHNYVDAICSECGHVQMVAPTVVSCYSKLQTSVKVTWTTQENVSGYQLWRTTTPDDAESWSLVKTINDPATDRYTNQGLTEGVTYYYKVRAFITAEDGTKVYSDFSNVDYMPATVLFDGPYSNATFRIRLRWLQIGGAHGYQIWRLNEDGSWSIVKTLGDKNNTLTDDQGATTAYSNTGLTAGGTYTYKMRAFMITEDGRKVFGAYSDEITVGVMPETPDATGSSPKTTRAQLSWDAVNGAAGYQIWMSTSPDSGFSIIKSITDGTATSYTKYDLQSGTTYYFKIRAYVEVDGKKTFGEYTNVIAITVK
ncbi:MAG: fibronectin type III domain-containing protein [Oscillospiraceae bacterium]|nr:fibronectin type III domain-containing protein [Oscillospiraceae bacterium]